MKVKVTKIFVCVLVYIMITLLLFVGIFEYCDKTAQTSIISNYSHAIDNFYINDGLSIESVEKLNVLVDNLPFYFVKEFRNEWKVVIGCEIPHTFLEHENIPLDYQTYGILIDGYTHWQTRIVFIREQADVNQMLNVFAHELGHCFDFEYGSISYSDEFQKIYESHRYNFIEKHGDSPNPYCTRSSDEFFATCFKEYVLFPGHLQNQSLQIYSFIDAFYRDIQNIKFIFVYDFYDIICTFRRLL